MENKKERLYFETTAFSGKDIVDYDNILDEHLGVDFKMYSYINCEKITRSKTFGIVCTTGLVKPDTCLILETELVRYKKLRLRFRPVRYIPKQENIITDFGIFTYAPSNTSNIGCFSIPSNGFIILKEEYKELMVSIAEDITNSYREEIPYKTTFEL